MSTIGLLNAQEGGGASETQIADIRLGLTDGGFIEGKNVSVEYRSDHWHIPELAADLVKRQVSVILCVGNGEGIKAAQESTSVIPIVFAIETPFDFDAYDTIVKGVGWPKANVSGCFWSPSASFASKRLDLLGKLVPNAKVVGYLDNEVNSGARTVFGKDYVIPESDEIKRTLAKDIYRIGGKLVVYEEAFTERRIESAFEDIARQGVEMLVVSPDTFLSSRRGQIADLARRHAIPAITGWTNLVAEGALISYSPVEGFRQAGIYAGRILRGAKPGDLPIRQLKQSELFINLKTAKALELTVPNDLLASADGIIK